ncbi:D-galactonate dehydratase [Cupriavidus metallidurans]|nr:D-galactonate dehydratase [Cupriavidus metallidurans]
MKIVSLETYVVAVPPPYMGGRYWIFVKLKTDDGIEGVGEVYAASFHPSVMVAAIADVYERYLESYDPHQVERFYREAYSSGFTQRPDISMMGVVSGLEMACWDIIGKAAGQPVYQLLGGRVHERLRSYTYLYPRAKKEFSTTFFDVDVFVECAVECAAQGFTAIKFDPAGPYTAYCGHQLSMEILEFSEKLCRSLREAVGSGCDLIVGTHGQMTPSAALRFAKRIEPFDPLWFEEPVPPGQAQAMASVAGRTTVPVAAGERLTTKYEFHDLLRHGAASILQMNLGRVGGLMEAKKIASLAEVHYAQIAPHLYNGPVGAAASFHLAAASPNFLIQESIQRWEGYRRIRCDQRVGVCAGPVLGLRRLEGSRQPGLGLRGRAAILQADREPLEWWFALARW